MKLILYHAHVTICNDLHQYKCSGCGMCFSEKNKTYNHMYKCRKKFTCGRCSIPFQDWKKLLHHCEIAHPRIECKICSSFFTGKELLDKHTKRYHNSSVSLDISIYCYVMQCSSFAYLILNSLYEMCLGVLHCISLYALSLHSTIGCLQVPFLCVLSKIKELVLHDVIHSNCYYI